MRCMMVVCLLGALPALSIAGCSDEPDDAKIRMKNPAPFKTTVNVTRRGYQPARTQVLVGGSVTFVNRDTELPHTAQTNSSGSPTWDEETDFDTHALTWGEPYTATFHKPGVFEYYCSFHSSMKGTVEVITRVLSRDDSLK